LRTDRLLSPRQHTLIPLNGHGAVKGCEITVDRRALSRLLADIAYVIWRIVHRVGLAMAFAVGVLSLLGSTPATAADLHILFSSLGILEDNNTIARIRQRRLLDREQGRKHWGEVPGIHRREYSLIGPQARATPRASDHAVMCSLGATHYFQTGRASRRGR
jgi:hypothetical protein